MAIRWDKLTQKSQEALQTAGQIAVENGNPELLPIHLLMALLTDKENIVVPLMTQAGAPPEQMLTEARQAVDRLPKVSGGSQPQMVRAWCFSGRMGSSPLCHPVSLPRWT